uniref:Reverse transcriptase domain-containing protein n=1 Tax=Xiphophorus maculatus TaxID=8083 RepID=A0A3B5RAA6_XIPMA
MADLHLTPATAVGREIHFTSFNCRGLNNPVKRSKVLHHMQRLGAQIAFLQETHLKNVDHVKLKRTWVSQVYHSSFNTKSRGVAILISKSVPYVHSQTISDSCGRYVIITGTICNIPVALANIYAPNYDNEYFFKHVFQSLPNLSTYHLILGGDFNCRLDPQLDRSSTNITMPSRSSKMINSFMSEFNVHDAWRFLHPSQKVYSFFSPVHHTFTRIDFFLIDNRLLSSLTGCKYDAIVLSDHAPVSISIRFDSHPIERPPWRLGTRLLSNEKFVSFVARQIDFFIENNRGPEVSASLLWETLKAFIRGEIISYVKYENKLRRERINTLTRHISQIDNLYAISPSPTLYKDRLVLQAEFDVLMTQHTTELLLQSGAQFYEHGDKAGKLLAHQIRRVSASRHISQIQTTQGITTDPMEINLAFKDFYRSLYSSECTPSVTDFDNFFNNLEVPTINQGVADDLERPIVISELTEAVKALQGGKCPGPDGYPCEFYRIFWDKLSPLLLEVYNESLTSGCLPQTLNQAVITLLAKKGKDPQLCSSYRPISLLNVDFKLLAKTIALRLETVLPTVVGIDQTGFVQNRNSFSNIRQLFNVIYSPPSVSTQEVVISLDAEKAFDRVEWPYLFYSIKKFGFGENFLSWIKLLYSDPYASIRTNNTQSDYFRLSRSTRQGCPLSPLLFALAIEPLAIALRCNTSIIGIKRNDTETKVSLYADDLLLYISNLNISIPAVLATLDKFGQLSGYKLNLSKSELLPANALAKSYPLHTLPFKVIDQSFTYLGIQVTSKYEDLFKANFSPLLVQVKEDFDRWSMLGLSLVARVNSIKMNILPRFSYLFQCIPIFLSRSFFSKLDSIITKFLWNGKAPRIRTQFLQRPKRLGGMALPNFRYYYWASNIRLFRYWLQSDSPSSPAWLVMEANSVKPVSLAALLHSPLQSSTKPYTSNKLVDASLRLWMQFRRHFGLQSLSVYSPIASNHTFQPSLTDGIFLSWRRTGILTFHDMYIDNTFASFQQISGKFGIPRHHFFRYLQVRSFVRSTYSDFPNLPKDSPLDIFLKPTVKSKGAISFFYNQITLLRPQTLNSYRSLWEEDLGQTISEDLWTLILSLVHKSSICARHNLIQCKLVYRTYYTKARLAKFYTNVSPACDRCQHSPANLIHTIWLCPQLFNYWSKVFAILSDIFDKKLELDPLTALFGVEPPQSTLSSFQKSSLAFLTFLARRVIIIKWKSPQPPSYTHWLRDTLYFIKLEKIRFTLRGSSMRFLGLWSPLLRTLRKINFPNIPD